MTGKRLVRDTWAALSAGHLSALEAALAPDAKRRAVEDGPWNCENRNPRGEAVLKSGPVYFGANGPGFQWVPEPVDLVLEDVQLSLCTHELRYWPF